ncbi:MAG: hypothetical protein KGI27_01870 [Thaumarchaeota archaeon]|nr:hypothetical protein [Nitrososphaerota archaeon]
MKIPEFKIKDEDTIILKNKIMILWKIPKLTTTQASNLLKIDWIRSINDLCALTKKHPYTIGDKGKFLRCEHCAGIISQIKDLVQSLQSYKIHNPRIIRKLIT